MTSITNATTPRDVQKAMPATSRRDGGADGSSNGAKPRHTSTKTTRYRAASTAIESVRSVFCLISVFADALALRQRRMSQLHSPINAAAATAWVNPAFAQATNVSAIPELPFAVCLSKSIAQRVAGAFS